MSRRVAGCSRFIWSFRETVFYRKIMFLPATSCYKGWQRVWKQTPAGAVYISGTLEQDSALGLSCEFFKNQKSKLRPLQLIMDDYGNPGRYISLYVSKNQRKIKEEALRYVMGMENLRSNETANPKSA